MNPSRLPEFMVSSAQGGASPKGVVDRERILLVDDEPELRQMVRRYLEAEGFEVTAAADGEEALACPRLATADLVVLDVGLPGMDGFGVLQAIRAKSEVPVIMLTARAEEIDRVLGLTIGADDYVTKPFSPRELAARVRAVLRRGRLGGSTSDDVLEFEGVTLDLPGRQVNVEGRTLELSALEFDLLAALATAPGRVFTRARLLESVWGWDYFGAERVVDVHVGNLRKALGDDASNSRFIGTVRGIGYKFLAPPK